MNRTRKMALKAKDELGKRKDEVSASSFFNVLLYRFALTIDF